MQSVHCTLRLTVHLTFSLLQALLYAKIKKCHLAINHHNKCIIKYDEITHKQGTKQSQKLSLMNRCFSNLKRRKPNDTQYS